MESVEIESKLDWGRMSVKKRSTRYLTAIHDSTPRPGRSKTACRLDEVFVRRVRTYKYLDPCIPESLLDKQANPCRHSISLSRSLSNSRCTALARILPHNHMREALSCHCIITVSVSLHCSWPQVLIGRPEVWLTGANIGIETRNSREELV